MQHVDINSIIIVQKLNLGDVFKWRPSKIEMLKVYFLTEIQL